jgi:hypothetical protein
MSAKKSKKAKQRHKEMKKDKRDRKVRKEKKPAGRLKKEKTARPKPGPGAKPKARAGTSKTTPASLAPAPAATNKPAAPKSAGGHPHRKSGRKSPLALRRGPDGQLFTPGDLLLPGGPQRFEEIQYLFRGCVAAEHPAGDAGVAEVVLKKTVADTDADRADLHRSLQGLAQRFDGGTIEPLLPSRAVVRRNFQGVVERAKHRRREIGAFLRGLDLGRTETSHMDSHGEASLQSLMEWAARLENLAEADEPDQADYNQFHRGLDQLENTTEALILDVEQTLRRLRDRVRASGRG